MAGDVQINRAVINYAIQYSVELNGFIWRLFLLLVAGPLSSLVTLLALKMFLGKGTHKWMGFLHESCKLGCAAGGA